VSKNENHQAAYLYFLENPEAYIGETSRKFGIADHYATQMRKAAREKLGYNKEKPAPKRRRKLVAIIDGCIVRPEAIPNGERNFRFSVELV
jgi:hypothetical protein